VRALARITGGNPFFVAEYLRAAVDAGWLARDRAGRWRLGADGRAFDAAPLLADLDEVARRLAEAAAVLGRALEAEILLALAGRRAAAGQGGSARPDPAALDVALATLRRRRILEEVGPDRWHFVHDKLREVAYAGLAAADKRALHEQAAEIISDHPGELTDRDAQLAHHWAGAARPIPASEAFVRAGRHAGAQHANGQAAALFRAGAEQARLAGKAPEAPALLLTSQEHEADLLALMGEQQRARHVYQAALQAVPECYRLARVRLTRKLGKTCEIHQEHAQALACYDEAEEQLGAAPEAAPRSDEAPVSSERLVGSLLQDAAAWWYEWVQLHIERAQVHYWAADQERLDEVVQRLLPVIGERGTAEQQARFFQSMVQRNMRAERFRPSAETVEHARRSLLAFEATGNAVEIATARFSYALTLLWSDRFERAEVPLMQALDEAEQLGHLPLTTRCLSYATMLARRQQDVAATGIFARRTLGLAAQGMMAEYMGVAEANLGWIAWRQDRPDDVLAQCSGALERWRGLPLSYPFQWLARLPLLAVAYKKGDRGGIRNHAAALLGAEQQALPEALSRPLRAILDRTIAGASPKPERTKKLLMQRASTATCSF